MNDLLYAKDGAIATITLNRPDRLNAISVPMLDARGLLAVAYVSSSDPRASCWPSI